MTASTDDRIRRGPGWLVTTLALLALCVLLALGTWQVQRLYWKQELIAAIEERTQTEALPLDRVLDMKQAGEPVEYRATHVTGRFLHEREQFFFATHEGRSGYYVYTPLERADGSLVFVNRGFVDVDFKDPASRPEGQVEGSVTVTGLAREPLYEKPSWIVPDNDPAKNIFYWKDIEAMAANAGIDRARLLDIFIDAGEAPNPGGRPEGGVTILNLPDNHLQYAVTWYGLAAVLVVVFVLRFFRRPDGTED